MSNSTLDGTPVATDSAERARLTAKWAEIMDVMEFNAWLLEQGYSPPDERPGWYAVYETGPNGEDVGLVWAEPSADEDDEDLHPDDELIAADGTVTRAGERYTPGGNRLDDLR